MTRILEELIFPVMDELRETIAAPQGFSCAPETPLFGQDAVLSSIDLVNLIIGVEERLETVLQVSLTLADERAMSRRKSPFRTVSTFAAYIQQRLDELQDEA